MASRTSNEGQREENIEFPCTNCITLSICLAKCRFPMKTTYFLLDHIHETVAKLCRKCSNLDSYADYLYVRERLTIADVILLIYEKLKEIHLAYKTLPSKKSSM